MADYSSLKQQAQTISNEKQIGANTATRVGGALEGIVDALIERNQYMKRDGNITTVSSVTTETGRRSTVQLLDEQVRLIHYPEEKNGVVSDGIGIVISDGKIGFFSELNGNVSPFAINKDGTVFLEKVSNDLAGYIKSLAQRIANLEARLTNTAEEQ